MDAGVAGLIGALGGGFLGAAGAWGAALIAFRGARYQADRQGNAAHEQWLRQLRRDACLRFISEARALLEVLDKIPHGQGDDFEAAIQQVPPISRRLKEAYEALELEASKDLLQSAKTVLKSGTDTRTAIAAKIRTGLEGTLRRSALIDSKVLRINLNVFIGQCKKALHEPAPMARHPR